MKYRLGDLLCLILPCLVMAVGFVFNPIQRVAASQPASGGQEKIKLDVHYEPSSEDVVQIMLDMAEVGEKDLVYDLGCGDGRIVIAAAQQRGARGIGVDLDPERIKESLANARRAGITDRVQFFQENLFQTEIGRATVVMLYLYPDVNLKLRPKLFRELKPSTRVVSHSHDMETWEPDQTRTASNGHKIYFWVMPANVSGTWEWTLPGEKDRYALTISQQFQKVSASLQLGSAAVPVKELQVRGDRFQFTVERLIQGKKQTLHFAGRVRGHLMEGTAVETTGSSQKQQTWKANRIPASMKPLDS